jgi:transformation/transcription domain-associated protein
MEYLAERMCSLCYERAWYAKLGGCIASKFLVERMAMRWVHEHLFLFLTALLFVMMDLTGEVGSPLYLSQFGQQRHGPVNAFCHLPVG